MQIMTIRAWRLETHKSHVFRLGQLTWNIKRIVAIFVAKHKLSLMEGQAPKIKSPIYFAIRKFLEINDLETLNKGWLFNQLREISDHYNDEYKVSYSFLVQYTEKLIPEYLNKQRQAKRRYGYRH